MSFDPGGVMVAVEKGAERLELAADEYYRAVLRYEKAENAYEAAVNKALIAIVHEYKQAGDKLPAEDVRRALAHDRIDAEVYAEYLEAKAQKEAQSVLYRALDAAVKARQSLLKALSVNG